MNKTKIYSDLQKKEQSQKRIVCVREENYLQELILNSKRIQRMQDFFSNLE